MIFKKLFKTEAEGMSVINRIEMTAAKAAWPVAGGGLSWPFIAPSAEEYAHTLNMLVLPTIGALIALFQLIITVRKWWRGSRWARKVAGYAKDEAGAIGKRAAGGVGVLALVMALAVPLTAKWEGLRTVSYQDVVGRWTACFGETRGIGPGDVFTVEQCREMLGAGLVEFYNEFVSCAPEMGKAPVEVQAAIVSWSYNVGNGAACKSTLARLVRAKDWRGACDQLPRWNRAGGRVWQGLINRRAEERELCLSGLT